MTFSQLLLLSVLSLKAISVLTKQ